MNEKIEIGIIGCGVIGTELAKRIEKEIPKAELIAVSDIDEKKALSLCRKLKRKPLILTVDNLIHKSDLIIEAAHPSIVKKLIKGAIENKKDIMIMSVGGIIGNEKLLKKAEKTNTKIYFPSGALCGLDGVKAACIGKIKEVTLETTKPPKGLEGAPYIVKNKIDLKKIKEKTVIFEGDVKEAVKGFPTNINVAAALTLAAWPNKVKVKIKVDPSGKVNKHEIEVKGEFGELEGETKNVPSPQNPKTSYLAVLSAISTLKQIVSNVRVGS